MLCKTNCGFALPIAVSASQAVATSSTLFFILPYKFESSCLSNAELATTFIVLSCKLPYCFCCYSALFFLSVLLLLMKRKTSLTN